MVWQPSRLSGTLAGEIGIDVVFPRGLYFANSMGGLDPKLAVPRRNSPRAVVPAGSVAIANEQTVVSPYAISGGWNVIGRTPMVLFDARRPRPSLLWPGDRVRFRAITRAEFIEMATAQ